MKNWKNTLITPSTTIREAIRVIDSAAVQIALVVDEQTRLLGTVTDGDVRRGILRGVSLETAVSEIMNVSPIVATSQQTQESILALMRKKILHQIPVLEDERRVVGLQIMEELLQPTSQENWVVLMAGGEGTRLRELTKNCPKPLLKVGNKPVLETILLNFIEQGFYRFYISINYLGDQIRQYFQDGSAFGCEIRYLEETQRLGTAGALGLIQESLSFPLIVMNGDIMSKVNFQQLLKFHEESQASGTMCVREYDFQVPYGVIQLKDHQIQSIEEKPVQRFFVNAGIYVLNGHVLEYLPKNQYFDMPHLFHQLAEHGQTTSAFPLREYWIDIGQMDDFHRANGEYAKHFEF